MSKKLYKKIYIEITNNCNLNCSFCSKSNRVKRNMTLEEVEEIFTKIKDYTDYIYLHVKGEPLLHKNIIEIISLADKYNLKVNLTTNGTLFKKYAKLLGKCKALRKINFSLHSENNISTYLVDIFDNVKYLKKDTIIIYRLWTLNNGLLDKKSTKIVEKIIDYYNLSTEIVDKLKLEKNIKISSTIYVDKDNEFIWPTLNHTKTSNGFCYALKTQLSILSDGTIVPCCLDSEGIIPLGNIFEDDLNSVIKTKKYQRLKQSFRERKPIEELCQKCTFKNKIN